MNFEHPPSGSSTPSATPGPLTPTEEILLDSRLADLDRSLRGMHAPAALEARLAQLETQLDPSPLCSANATRYSRRLFSCAFAICFSLPSVAMTRSNTDANPTAACPFPVPQSPAS